MNTYEYQSLMPRFDFCPRSLRFMLTKMVCGKASGSIEAKFQMESLWFGRTKICDQDGRHAHTR